VKRWFCQFSMIACLGVGSLEANQLPHEQRRNGELMQSTLKPVQIFFQQSSAVFYEGNHRFLYGSVVSADGLILTKASELAKQKEFTVRIGKTIYREPKILVTNEEWDLTLVKVDAQDLTPVNWDSSDHLERGYWVASNSSTTRRKRRVRVGIISADSRPISGLPVVLGLTLDEELVVQEVKEGGGGEEAGILKKDQLLELNGEEIKDRKNLAELLKPVTSGDVVKLKIKRAKKELEFDVVLKARSEVYEGPGDRNEAMSGRISDRRGRFPKVLQHDTTMSEETMGGPLMTLDGRGVGLNIAIADRVTAFAIPSEEVQEVFERMKKEAGTE